MKKHLKEQVDSLTAFEAFCNANQPIWTGVDAFATGVTGLGVKVQSIYTTESQQEENNKGVARTKTEKKTDMANEAVAVAQATQAYARSINDNDLYDAMSKPFTTIMKEKDSPAISSCQKIYDTVNGLPIDALKPFGISDAVLNTLKQSIDQFATVAPTTRNVITNKTVLTNNCSQLVSEGNGIMRKDLLKIGRMFKKTNPDFYSGLVANSKVITNSTHAKIRLTVTDERTGAVLTGALVEVDGTGLQALTDMQGKCTITKVPAGKRNVTVKKTDYDVLTLEAVNFQRGKSITLTVSMSPKVIVASAVSSQSEKVVS